MTLQASLRCMQGMMRSVVDLRAEKSAFRHLRDDAKTFAAVSVKLLHRDKAVTNA